MPDSTGDKPEVDQQAAGTGLGTHDLHEAAAHGLRWSALSRPTTEVIQLASLVVLARLIVPAEFGRYSIAIIAQQIAYVIVAGGLGGALVQRKTIKREHLQAGMAMALISGVGLAVLTLLAAVFIVTPIFGARTGLFVEMMAPLCLVSSLNIVPSSTLSRRMAFRRLSEIEVFSTLSRVIACIGLALAGLDGEALVIGLLVGALVGAIIAWVSAPPPLPRLHRQAARELMDYGVPASLAAVSWVGFNNVDYAVVGARLGAVQTGFYFRAYTLAVEYQNKVSVVMTQIGFPVLAQTRDQAALTRLFKQMVRTLTIALFPLLILLAITAPAVVPLLYGPQWNAAIVPVQILAIGGAATLVISAVGTVLIAKGQAKALLGFGVGHFIVYGTTSFLIVPLGIVALAIDAAVVHTIFLFVAYAVMLRDSAENPVKRLWSDTSPALVACIGLAAVAVPASIGLGAMNLPRVIWLIGVCLAGIPPYLLTLKVCCPEAWRAQQGVLRRVLRRRQHKPTVGQPLIPTDVPSSA